MAQMDIMAKELEALRGSSSTIVSSTQVAAVAKLRPFRGTKFTGKKEEFENFMTQYEAIVRLDTEKMQGWTDNNQLAFLVSALEGKALEAVRILMLTHSTYGAVLQEFRKIYEDAEEGERALARLQTLNQTGGVEEYVREFNMTVARAAKVAKVQDELLLRYFYQGLKERLRLAVAATRPATHKDAQNAAIELDIILKGREGGKTEQMP